MSQQQFFNGLDGVTGKYLMDPMTDEALGKKLANLPEERVDPDKVETYRGAIAGVDLNLLEQSGWALVMAAGAEQRMPGRRAALEPLCTLREGEAGSLYRDDVKRPVFYQPGESAATFLGRYCARLEDPVRPTKLPYYLLLVGGPEEIPYSVQFDLDLQYAVGRICFEEVEHYSAYARGVVAAREGRVRTPRQVALFGTRNRCDGATARTADELIRPLAASLASERSDWAVQTHLAEKADRARLGRLLGGGETPALLVTASHGVGFPCTDEAQQALQGALVCQDWQGPEGPPLSRTDYLAAADIPDEAEVGGLVAFLFACYSAGTPERDSFRANAFGRPSRIAPKDLVSRLPQRLLSHPNGAALAVIGHVDRAWSCSFSDGLSRAAQNDVFTSALFDMLDGMPLGAAMEYFAQRYGALGARAAGLWEALNEERRVSMEELGHVWRAKNDARNFVLFGDPAVRLAQGATFGQPEPELYR